MHRFRKKKRSHDHQRAVSKRPPTCTPLHAADGLLMHMPRGCADAAAAERIEMVAKAGGDIETERREMVSENPLSITVEDRRLEEGINPVFDAALQELNGKPGITSMQEVDGQIRFVQIVEVVAPTGKTLDEARGKVIADYQDHLEKSWIAELRARYDVEVNTDALHAIR